MTKPPEDYEKDQTVLKYQLERVANDKCPRCRGGELDTGYECNYCGYDAGWLASFLPFMPDKTS